MARPGYPHEDDPEEAAAAGKPHTQEETSRLRWARAWRALLHAIEEAMLALPEVRAGLINGLEQGPPQTVYEAGIGAGLVSTSVPGLEAVREAETATCDPPSRPRRRPSGASSTAS